MSPVGVEYFYSKFESMLYMPEYLAVVSSAFILIVLVKTGIFMMTGYKGFWKAMLISGISNLISVAAVVSFFLLKIRFTDDLLTFCSVMIFGFLMIDLIVAILFKGKSGLWDGIIGAALGNVIVACFSLVILIFVQYPLYIEIK